MQKVKVLVVEDEVALSRTFRLALEAEGFDVSVAGDGLECLRLVRQERPDVLVLDVMLPELDGFKDKTRSVTDVIGYHSKTNPLLVTDLARTDD